MIIHEAYKGLGINGVEEQVVVNYAELDVVTLSKNKRGMAQLLSSKMQQQQQIDGRRVKVLELSSRDVSYWMVLKFIIDVKVKVCFFSAAEYLTSNYKEMFQNSLDKFLFMSKPISIFEMNRQIATCNSYYQTGAIDFIRSAKEKGVHFISY
jgi:hypothetical protein